MSTSLSRRALGGAAAGAVAAAALSAAPAEAAAPAERPFRAAHPRPPREQADRAPFEQERLAGLRAAWERIDAGLLRY